MAYLHIDRIKTDPNQRKSKTGLILEGRCGLCGAYVETDQVPEAYQGHLSIPVLHCPECGVELKFNEKLLEILQEDSKELDYEFSIMLSNSHLEKFKKVTFKNGDAED